MLARLPNFAKAAGGIGLFTSAMIGMTKAADKASENAGLRKLDSRVQKFVGRRDMTGLTNLRDYVDHFGGHNQKFLKEIDRGIAKMKELDQQDLSHAEHQVNGNWNEMEKKGKASLGRLAGYARTQFGIIRNTTVKNSDAARAAASTNFHRATKEIQKPRSRTAAPRRRRARPRSGSCTRRTCPSTDSARRRPAR